MQIKKMTIEDYDSIFALWISCPGMGINNLDDSREGIDQFLKRNPDTCFVAIDGEQIVGTILVGNDGRRGYIYHTAVASEYQKQGIGAEMVESALQALRECGIHKVALVAFERNKAGNAFWEKMGFTVREDLVYRNKELDEMVRINV